MTEEKKMLSMLQVTVPPDTALTVTAQIKILEILGIVSTPELVKSAEIAADMIPANTPASLHGLLVLLNNIVKHHPKSDKSHTDKLEEVMKDVAKLPESFLTYGSFLTICSGIMNAKQKEAANQKKKPNEKAPSKKKVAVAAAKK